MIIRNALAAGLAVASLLATPAPSAAAALPAPTVLVSAAQKLCLTWAPGLGAVAGETCGITGRQAWIPGPVRMHLAGGFRDLCLTLPAAATYARALRCYEHRGQYWQVLPRDVISGTRVLIVDMNGPHPGRWCLGLAPPEPGTWPLAIRVPCASPEAGWRLYP